MSLTPPPGDAASCWDEIHQREVEIVGRRETPVGEWPLHRTSGKHGINPPSMVVTRELAEFIRATPVAEAARILGVGNMTVARWRKMLGITDPSKWKRNWTREEIRLANTLSMKEAMRVLVCSRTTILALRHHPSTPIEDVPGVVVVGRAGKIRMGVDLLPALLTRAQEMAHEATRAAGRVVHVSEVLAVALRHGLGLVEPEEAAAEGAMIAHKADIAPGPKPKKRRSG